MAEQLIVSKKIVTTNSPETQTNHKHDVKYCPHTQCQAMSGTYIYTFPEFQRMKMHTL